MNPETSLLLLLAAALEGNLEKLETYTNLLFTLAEAKKEKKLKQHVTRRKTPSRPTKAKHMG